MTPKKPSNGFIPSAARRYRSAWQPDWATTPASVKELVEQLACDHQELRERVTTVNEQLISLAERMTALKSSTQRTQRIH